MIQSAFRAVSPATSGFRVERLGDPKYTAEWFVYYDGFADETPLLIFYTFGLAGGKAGTSP